MYDEKQVYHGRWAAQTCTAAGGSGKLSEGRPLSAAGGPPFRSPVGTARRLRSLDAALNFGVVLAVASAAAFDLLEPPAKRKSFPSLCKARR